MFGKFNSNTSTIVVQYKYKSSHRVINFSRIRIAFHKKVGNYRTITGLRFLSEPEPE